LPICKRRPTQGHRRFRPQLPGHPHLSFIAFDPPGQVLFRPAHRFQGRPLQNSCLHLSATAELRAYSFETAVTDRRYSCFAGWRWSAAVSQPSRRRQRKAKKFSFLLPRNLNYRLSVVPCSVADVCLKFITRAADLLRLPQFFVWRPVSARRGWGRFPFGSICFPTAGRAWSTGRV